MTLLEAAKDVIAQFERIKAHQYELLVHGQNITSASANWDKATLGQSIDFTELIAAVHQSSAPPPAHSETPAQDTQS